MEGKGDKKTLRPRGGRLEMHDNDTLRVSRYMRHDTPLLTSLSYFATYDFEKGIRISGKTAKRFIRDYCDIADTYWDHVRTHILTDAQGEDILTEHGAPAELPSFRDTKRLLLQEKTIDKVVGSYYKTPVQNVDRPADRELFRLYVENVKLAMHKPPPPTRTATAAAAAAVLFAAAGGGAKSI